MDAKTARALWQAREYGPIADALLDRGDAAGDVIACWMAGEAPEAAAIRAALGQPAPAAIADVRLLLLLEAAGVGLSHGPEAPGDYLDTPEYEAEALRDIAWRMLSAYTDEGHGARMAAGAIVAASPYAHHGGEGSAPRQENGYAIVYFNVDGGRALCGACVVGAVYDAFIRHGAADAAPVVRGAYSPRFQAHAHPEGPDLECEECGREMPSDYGDPYEDDDDEDEGPDDYDGPDGDEDGAQRSH